MPAMTNDSTPTQWRPSMTDRSDGYVTDTVYTWGFYGDMSPFNLNYIAMMHGFAPVDLDRQFSYLELGCGNGVSSNVFAACHPTGQFHAVDLNPEHTDNARAMADGGMLSNIHVHNTTFGELDLGALPMFDFIVLHGIYSWVAPKVRSEIIRIIKNKLLPGGYAFVSYNALPGGAQKMPLREMMLRYSDGSELSSMDRAREGLRYLRFLKEKKSAFFAKNPEAAKMLDRLLKQDLSYISHEFLNEHWHCFYFREVAREFRAAGCHYVGSSPLYMNIRNLIIPKQFREVLNSARNRTVFETHKSLVLNEGFRRDIFTREPGRRMSSHLLSYWDRLYFQAEPATLEEFRFSTRIPSSNITYRGSLYKNIATALIEEGSQTPSGLAKMMKIADDEIGKMIFALHVLVSARQVFASRTPLGKADKAPTKYELKNAAHVTPRRFRLKHPFNRHILKEHVSRGTVPLACPATGSAVSLPESSRLVIYALQEAGVRQKPEEWLYAFLVAANRQVMQNGVPIKDARRARKHLKNVINRASLKVVPRIKRFGLIEMAS